MGGRLFNSSPPISPSRDLPVRIPNLPSRIRVRSRHFEEEDVFNEVENGVENRAESGAIPKGHDAGYEGGADSHSKFKSRGNESNADCCIDAEANSTIGDRGAGGNDRNIARETGSDARGGSFVFRTSSSDEFSKHPSSSIRLPVYGESETEKAF